MDDEQSLCSRKVCEDKDNPDVNRNGRERVPAEDSLFRKSEYFRCREGCLSMLSIMGIYDIASSATLKGFKIGNQCASKLTEKTGWKHKEANEFCDSRENLGYHASRGGRHFPENEYEGHFLLSLLVISMKIHLTTGWTC